MTRAAAAPGTAVITKPLQPLSPLTALWSLLLAAALVLPGWAVGAAPAVAHDQLGTIGIGARDGHYEMTRHRVHPGPIAVRFANLGSLTHALQTARLDPGRTEAEFRQVLLGFLDGTVQEAPQWLHQDVPFAFGPTSPHRTVTAFVDVVQPGRYVLFDLLTDHSGRTFAEQGMVASFVVAGDRTSSGLPPADAVIGATDTSFQVPRLHAGQLVLRLQNHASVERQFAIVLLRRGRTLDDLREWLEAGQVGPAPGEFVANALPIAPGTDLLLKARLEPGRYLLVDNGESEDGTPYTELGLLTHFPVGRT